MFLDWVYLVMYAVLAGAAIALAAGVSRRVGVWGGVLAAAPVTPTFAVLIFTGAGRSPDLLAGVPVIVATLVVLAVLAGLVHPSGGSAHAGRGARPGNGLIGRLPFGLYLVLLVPPLAWSISKWVPLGALLMGLVVIAVFAGYRLRRVPRAATSRGVSVLGGAGLRFLMGGLSVFAVALALELLPSAAAAVALFPLVFTAGIVVSEIDGGRAQAGKVMAGGVPGSMGVAAFVIVVAIMLGLGVQGAGWLLLGGWLGYFAVSAGWLAATRIFQVALFRYNGRGPASVPGIQKVDGPERPGWASAPSHE